VSLVAAGGGGGDLNTVLHKTLTKKIHRRQSDHSIGPGRHFIVLTNVAVPSGKNIQLIPTLRHIKTF